MIGATSLAVSAIAVMAASGPVATPDDLAHALQACFRAPARTAGSQVVVRFSLDSRGALQRRPQIVGSASVVSESDRRALDAAVLDAAVLDALRRCTPLSLTPGFAASVAGRVLTLRLIGGPRPQNI